MNKIAGSLTVLLAVAAVDAHANLITNGGFENTNNTFVGDSFKVMQVASGSTTIPGWTMTNGVPTAWIMNGNPWAISASQGLFFLDFTSYSNVGTYGGVTQSFPTVVGSSYVTTFDLGYGGNSVNFRGPVSVRATAGNFSGTLTSGSGSPNPAVWNAETFTFTATSSLTQLTIVGLSTAGGQYIGLDNVDVEAAGTVPGGVPEPGTATFLLTGIGLFGWVARRSASMRQ